MMYQYHCACCNKVLSSKDKECSHCGSHHIRSPFNAWVFCVMACLAVVVTIKLVHVFVQDQQSEVLEQQTLLDVLKQDKNRGF
ncbi:hypothetical protein [Acinetobacter sp. WZC-1]|uniref:hypothetical protein n=1 Tax=Acinetobacter sp. WZC-1 TaxID=3459034 RepID=UPI00403E3453